MRIVKRNRGFTTLEVMVVIGLMSLAVFVLFDVALQASRMAAKVDSRNSTLAKTREGYEMLSRDLRMADRVLAQYPPTGAATFTSRERDTIVLRIPNGDADGNVVANSWTVVIYRLNVPNGAAVTGEDYDAEYNLERWTATMAGGVNSAATLERVVGRGVCHLSFAYQGIDTYEGDGWRKIYGLEGTPIGNGSGITQSVMVNGVNWLGTMANIVGTNVEFDWAPRYQTMIDINYRVDPSAPVNAEGGNAAEAVTIRVRGRARWQNREQQGKENKIELNSQVRLLNR